MTIKLKEKNYENAEKVSYILKYSVRIFTRVPCVMQHKIIKKYSVFFINKLFEKCLNISHIDLWKCFLAYLRETKITENGYK